MRVAIPTFGTDISPRFCFAQEMIVVEMNGETELCRSNVFLGETSWPERLAILTAQHVEVLLCGGFPRQHQSVAESAGIQVVVGLAGAVEDVLAAFRRNQLDDFLVVPSSQRARCPRPQRIDDSKGKHHA